MVVVVLTAGGAILALWAYNTLKVGNPEVLTTTLFSIKQQAGVMAAICAAIFAVITALESAKAPMASAMAGVASAATTSSPTMPTFGRPAALGVGAP